MAERTYGGRTLDELAALEREQREAGATFGAGAVPDLIAAARDAERLREALEEILATAKDPDISPSGRVTKIRGKAHSALSGGSS